LLLLLLLLILLRVKLLLLLLLLWLLHQLHLRMCHLLLRLSRLWLPGGHLTQLLVLLLLVVVLLLVHGAQLRLVLFL
jgi:hypothetical protein